MGFRRRARAVSLRRAWELLLVGGVLLLCGGCIPVEDLGDYWARGTVDPQLDGDWRRLGARYGVEEFFLWFRRSGSEYNLRLISAATPPIMPHGTTIRARTFRSGNHSFLMLMMENPFSEERRGQRHLFALQRYSLVDSTLTVYQLDEQVLDTAIKQGEVAGRAARPQASRGRWPSMEDLPALRTLDDRSVAFIVRLADQPDLWSDVQRYERVANLDDALKTARAYPVTAETPANTLIAVDLPDLQYFADGRAGVLRRHLEASPEWLVTKDGREIVAFRRVFEHGRWDGLSNGFHSWFDEQGRFFQTRHMFRFEEEGAGEFANEFNRSFLKLVGPLAGEINLNLKVSDQGIQSYLAIGQPGLWFEFLEQTPNEDRVLTREALDWVAEFLKKIRDSENEIRRRGFASALMPADSTRLGAPSLEVADHEYAQGIYKVVAWANPGREGLVSLKAFDAETKAELSGSQISLGQGEFMGWSDNPKRQFRYDATVLARQQNGQRHFRARLELWLHPSDGSPEVKLAETTRTFDAIEY